MGILSSWRALKARHHNRRVDRANSKLAKSKRPWQALRLGGGGIVDLGICNAEQARRKTAEFGNVRFVDTEVAVVIYGDKSSDS